MYDSSDVLKNILIVDNKNTCIDNLNLLGDHIKI